MFISVEMLRIIFCCRLVHVDHQRIRRRVNFQSGIPTQIPLKADLPDPTLDFQGGG
jgi:hypothetical protein